jgi:hypothetical protein
LSASIIHDVKDGNPITRESISGPFTAAEFRPGMWQLTTDLASGPEVHLLGAGPEAPKLLERVNSLSVEWRTDGVLVEVSGPDGVFQLRAESALIHQPRLQLYDSLPLASFDADAQRFWKRVFRLIRLPGGRWLLDIVARRRRPTAPR